MEDHYVRIIDLLENWIDVAKFKTSASEKSKLITELSHAIIIRTTKPRRVLIS